ncbi:hypothetical protein CSUB01_00174 [Colletotrichum sublineola]|uniref:Uncharacterized protein n=1 Tax=Colletotrichum sublineola TaxID=1173701 RepID=A0A066XAQ3_COLSU|nr:hypothetical protein CSUB01_00174 [Colletotrichum sublineola]
MATVPDTPDTRTSGPDGWLAGWLGGETEPSTATGLEAWTHWNRGTLQGRRRRVWIRKSVPRNHTDQPLTTTRLGASHGTCTQSRGITRPHLGTMGQTPAIFKTRRRDRLLPFFSSSTNQDHPFKSSPACLDFTSPPTLLDDSGG